MQLPPFPALTTLELSHPHGKKVKKPDTAEFYATNMGLKFPWLSDPKGETWKLFGATDMPTNAPALYSLLTGRVSSINRSVVSDEVSKQYGAFQPIVRNHQREVGLYFQDSWRLHPRLTFNYGVRWDRQNPPVNDNGVYTRTGYAGTKAPR